MAKIPRRNVHVFGLSNGAEVAGKFSRSPLLPAYNPLKRLKASSNTEAFQSPRLSVGSTKSASFPSNGPFTHGNSTTTAPWAAWHLILAVGTLFNLGVTSYALCLLVRLLTFFFQCRDVVS